jgi:hypothetical protein
MQDVRFDEVGGVYQVPQDPGIRRHGHAAGFIQSQDRGHAVSDRANPTNPLGDVRGVSRVAADQNVLEAAEKQSACPDVDHLLNAVDGIDLNLDSEMAFDPGHGVE